MVTSRKACAIHLAVIEVASTIAMVVHIWRKRKTSKKTDSLFAALGLSNFSLSAFTIFRSFMLSLTTLNDTRTSLLDAVLFGLHATLSNINLSLNVAIAYSRFCAVAEPMKYSEKKERSKLQRRLIAIIVVGSLALGIATGVALGFVRIRLVRNWIEAVSRFITYVLLCILYVKIFRAIKVHNQSVINAVSTGGQMENNSIYERHQNHEKYLMKLFLGITISFLVFNLPIMIIGPLISVVTGCESIEGKVSSDVLHSWKSFRPNVVFFFFGGVPMRDILHKETLKKCKWPTSTMENMEYLFIKTPNQTWIK